MGEVTREALITRATIANVVAGIVVVSTTIWAITTGNAEMLKYIAAFALGYLFGARKPA